MENIVLSLGGSVILAQDHKPCFLRELSRLIKDISKTYRLFVVTGGGRLARDIIELGRRNGLNEERLDTLGIDITRVNAKLLLYLLDSLNPIIPTSIEEASRVDKRIVVMGGTTPGHSTDLVSAELAEKTKASRFVNATNVDGIYDKDPNRYKDAKMIKKINVDELIERYGVGWRTAGAHAVIDPPSLQVIKRARIPTFIVNGKRLDQLEKAMKGLPFEGTIIES
ncbi:MAG: UMP kinase [Candidatus Thermoplasmatota archaeon]